jgi:GNAT superfamily N-acetyltransferase
MNIKDNPGSSLPEIVNMTESSGPKQEWSLRVYREGDEEQILALRGIVLSGPKDKQWWQWMYRDGPLSPAVIMLAEANQKIIGQTAFIFVPIKIKDQITQGGHGIDLMVHPDYRRQGIFIALHKAANEYTKNIYRSIAYGTPNDQSRPGFVNRLNAMEICEVPILLKVIDWGNLLKSRYKIPVFIGKLLGYVWESITSRASPPKNAEIEVEEVFSFDERINQFWEKASKLKNIMIAKDMKYLNWRYIAKPGKEYKILIAQKHQEIAGYIVLKLKKGIPYNGYIVDLLTLPSEDTAATMLITRAVQSLKEDGAATISCWMLEDTPYYRILRKLGFVRRTGPLLCSRVIDTNIPKEFVTNPANWYYVMGDDDAL